MISVQQRINSRLTSDTVSGGLQTLLGGSGRIFAGMDYNLPKSPCVVFNNLSSVPGDIQGDNVMVDVEYWTFKVFSDNCKRIVSRLRVLLDRYTLAQTEEAGGMRCVWDGDGPDMFDDDLHVRRKDTRFRVYVIPRAQGEPELAPPPGEAILLEDGTVMRMG